MKRWLITGERDWRDWRGVAYALKKLKATFGDELVIVHGGCPTGADYFADELCHEMGITVEAYPVNHAIDGQWPAAGPRRNARMLRSGPFEGASAFWSGRTDHSGTLDCMSRAVAAGLNVAVIADGRPRKVLS